MTCSSMIYILRRYHVNKYKLIHSHKRGPGWTHTGMKAPRYHVNTLLSVNIPILLALFFPRHRRWPILNYTTWYIHNRQFERIWKYYQASVPEPMSSCLQSRLSIDSAKQSLILIYTCTIFYVYKCRKELESYSFRNRDYLYQHRKINTWNWKGLYQPWVLLLSTSAFQNPKACKMDELAFHGMLGNLLQPRDNPREFATSERFFAYITRGILTHALFWVFLSTSQVVHRSR